MFARGCVIPDNVCRLVHQDGSLADLTMLSASSVEAALARDEQEPQEEQKEWGAESKEQPLVVVIPTAEMSGEKTGIFSEQRQSSTDESYRCSAGTEPSTEQSSGNKHANVHANPFSRGGSKGPISCRIRGVLVISGASD